MSIKILCDECGKELFQGMDKKEKETTTIAEIEKQCLCAECLLKKEEEKDVRVFLEVDISAVANCKGYSGWAMIAETNKGNGGTEKITAEGILVRPDITFCLVAQYLSEPDKEDKNKEVEVHFADIISSVPLFAIKRVILRP